MDAATLVEELWIDLYIEEGKSSFDERRDYILSTLGREWQFQKAMVSILTNKGHYCICGRSTNSYYIFSSKTNFIHVGDCCLEKVCNNKEECESAMILKKEEMKETITTKRRIHNKTYTNVYPNRTQRTI